jgi:hypothetical protein
LDLVRFYENWIRDDVAPLLADATEAAEVAGREAEQDAGKDVSREARGGSSNWTHCHRVVLYRIAAHCSNREL